MQKVADLTGEKLDYWVGKADGLEIDIYDDKCFLRGVSRDWMENPMGNYSPSTKWSQGGPIIDREIIGTYGSAGYPRHAQIYHGGNSWTDAEGPTFLIAAMRCFVASKFGDEVPDE